MPESLLHALFGFKPNPFRQPVQPTDAAPDDAAQVPMVQCEPSQEAADAFLHMLMAGQAWIGCDMAAGDSWSAPLDDGKFYG